MADRVQAYNQASVPWIASRPENNGEGHPTDFNRRHPHRAATSPPHATMSSQMNPYLSHAAYPPASLYPGQRNPQTTHRSDIYFSQNKSYAHSSPLYPSYPTDDPVPGPTQLYPAHQQQFYGTPYYNHHDARIPSPTPPVPVPPKPPALQETGQNGRHAPLHPAMYRSFTSPPPVPPKPSLLFEPDSGSAVIPTSAYLGNSRPRTAGMTSTAGATSPPPVPPLPSGAVTADPPVVEPSTDQQLQEGEDDRDDLAVALALSKDESEREEERVQELVRLEEEEFERALAASMLTASGGYDYYESQPGAGPSNQTSSTVQSSPLAIPPDVYPEAGPSTSSAASLSLEAPANDAETASSPAQKKDELNPEEKTSWASEGTEPIVDTVRAPPPQTAQRRSIDNDQDEVPPTYSPTTLDQTPTALSFLPTANQPKLEIPKTETPEDDDDDDDDNDDDGDGLPYLKGTRGALSVSIPTSTESQGRSRLSPVSASFIDLSYDDSYIDEDEAFARRLVEEEFSQGLAEGENDAPRQEDYSNGQEPRGNLSRNSSATSASTRPRPDTPNDLPTYNDVMSISSGLTSQRSTFLPEVSIDSPASPEKSELVRNFSVASAPIGSTSSQPAAPFSSSELSAVTLPPDGAQRVIGRVSSMSALVPSRPPIEDGLPPTPVDDLATPTNHLSLNPRASHLTTTSISGTSNSSNVSSGPNSTGVLNANLFIDTDLLHGVSIQFTPPVISAKLAPMQGQMPTLISLPYGRCPPLHFQAPSWRHLLKLMARLSGTKMEPSIEAMAVAKNETLRLRTVIQFMKPHHMSDEWRTILWFTIDHPVPPTIPNATKYGSTNVNNLPFSYTLSSVPAMLKDASDTFLSKTYTIPATASVPYPSLPITFPNLALYLQAALDDSRQQSESSPLHKLAKMVQGCYPNDLVPQDLDEPENSRGVSGLFKRVMGRGGKKGKKGGGGNEDTYDLVTPFVPDEWG